MHLKHHGAFGRYAPVRLLLKCKIMLKGAPSSGTEVDPK